MEIAIAGGHGQIALHLGPRLAAEGHSVRGLIRNPEQSGDLEQIGVEPVVFDIEQHDAGELAHAIEGADAVVFAAGAGPGSGAERKNTMDRDGAIKLLEATRAVGARRYVMVSAMGAKPGVEGDEVFAVYLRAKFEADEALRASDLHFTIIRPGRLTDDPPTGRVSLAAELGGGSISRADVAHVLAVVLPAENTIGKTLDLVEGDTPVEEAVASV